MDHSYELGILGAGNMAEAIVRGLTASKNLSPEQIFAADVSAERRSFFEQQLGIATSADVCEVARASHVLLLSVKPQHMKPLLGQISPQLKPTTLLVSIAAAISTTAIQTALGGEYHVVRAMPNTPVLVGTGMVALCPGSHATAYDMQRARSLFSSSATVVVVNETQMDAVTAISGSGPAYFFFLVEQMIAAGVTLGLDPAQARLLAVTTALGAAKMLTQSSDSAPELRRKVTSPNGTTHAAITHMERAGWPETTIEAIIAAARRSAELGT